MVTDFSRHASMSNFGNVSRNRLSAASDSLPLTEALMQSAYGVDLVMR